LALPGRHDGPPLLRAHRLRRHALPSPVDRHGARRPQVGPGAGAGRRRRPRRVPRVHGRGKAPMVTYAATSSVGISFGPRRGVFFNAADLVAARGAPLGGEGGSHFEAFDLVYRTLCAVMYNYVPLSGHPGGSISSGRFVALLLFDAMDYDLACPGRRDADIISYAAGHKALGLYALWALRNEVARIAAPELVPP